MVINFNHIWFFAIKAEKYKVQEEIIGQEWESFHFNFEIWRNPFQVIMVQIILKVMSLQTTGRTSPGGPVAKNLPALQGIEVQSLVQEDPTYHGVTKPIHQSYWSPQALEPMLYKRNHCNEKPNWN